MSQVLDSDDEEDLSRLSLTQQTLHFQADSSLHQIYLMDFQDPFDFVFLNYDFQIMM